MRESNQKAVATEPMSVEEYIRFELQSERRHEYINGQLFEMSGEKRANHQIARRILIFLVNWLEAKGYEVFSRDMKVANRDRTKYFYPDVFATKEAQIEQNEYIQYEPELILEVISPTTRTTDLVDKYLEYTNLPSLRYYLLVEPELAYVTVHARTDDGKWEATLYASLNDVIPLPRLGVSLPLSEIYR